MVERQRAAWLSDRDPPRSAQRAKHRQTRRRLDFVGTERYGIRYRTAFEQSVQDDRRSARVRDPAAQGIRRTGAEQLRKKGRGARGKGQEPHPSSLTP